MEPISGLQLSVEASVEAYDLLLRLLWGLQVGKASLAVNSAERED